MPSRPANISASQDILQTVNQLMRELAIRIDAVQKTIPLHHIVSATAALNFGSVPVNGSVDRNMRVAGAKQVGSVSASPQLPIGAHLSWSAFVNGTDTVTIRVTNPTTGPIVANTVVWNAHVTQ